MKIQFEATPEGNTLLTVDGAIRATCPVPAGASDDYGYLTLKAAILNDLKAHHIPTDDLEFWYDGQEDNLEPDASATCSVSLDIDYDEMPCPLWYALMTGPDDDDWGTGTYDREEAIARLHDMRGDYPDAYIAVIQEGENPTCIDEIR